MKKKIAFVINYFHPDLASTGQLMTDLCLFLQKDFTITVIAAQPNYAGEKIENVKKIEIGYLENIKIIRIKLPDVNKNSKMSRLKYMISYFLLANFILLRERGVDIIFTISQPPILGGLIGSIGKFIKKSKHIYNIQDFNPEQAIAINYSKNQFLFKLAKLLDKVNCRFADIVLLVGNDMSETLRKRFNYKNVPNYTIVNNWTDEDNIVPLNKDNKNVNDFLQMHGLKDKFIFMYSGNIGLFYDLENIIKVIARFKDNTDIAFVFIGDGAVKNQIQSFSNNEKLKNVYFFPYQKKEIIKYSLNAADVHLVVNQKGIKGVSVPSKIYGVMATGKPILGILEQGSEAADLILKSNNGVIVEPQNYEDIFNAINRLKDENSVKLNCMGMNGRLYLEKHLKKETSLNKYKKLLSEV